MTETAPGSRRPRFRRAEAPAFRLTGDDVEMIRQLARYRFLRSTHIAVLMGRSLDRTNDRLHKLFTPAMSTGRGPSSTSIQPPARRRWSMPSPIAARAC